MDRPPSSNDKKEMAREKFQRMGPRRGRLWTVVLRKFGGGNGQKNKKALKKMDKATKNGKSDQKKRQSSKERQFAITLKSGLKKWWKKNVSNQRNRERDQVTTGNASWSKNKHFLRQIKIGQTEQTTKTCNEGQNLGHEKGRSGASNERPCPPTTGKKTLVLGDKKGTPSRKRRGGN